jgi:membrane-associated phospholipid phosphatase
MRLMTESADPPARLLAYRWAGTAFLAGMMLWFHLTSGIRIDYIILVGAFCALFWIGDRSAHFGVRAFPFLFVGLFYENLRFMLPLRREPHVADLYAADLALFGVDGQVLPKFLEAHTHPILDAICGASYALYLTSVFAVGIAFWFFDRPRMSRLAYGFLTVHLLGTITWLAFPAAPPWYVDQHGLGPAIMDAAPSAAGTIRFDQLFGIDLFGPFYRHSINVFGAMPSLHVGYPTVIACAAWSLGWKWRAPTIGFAMLMGFAAVYLQHHYVLDVIAGALYGIASFGMVVSLSRALSRKVLDEGSLDARNLELAQR